jgi:hypothetical protein
MNKTKTNYSVVVTALTCCLNLLGPSAVADDSGAPPWRLGNEKIALEIRKTGSGAAGLVSLRDVETGYQWAPAQGTLGAFLEGASGSGAQNESGFALTGVRPTERELVLSFANGSTGATLEVRLKTFPGRSVIEYAATLENRGKAVLPLLSRVDPLLVSLKAGHVRALGPVPSGHGFGSPVPVSGTQHFSSWLALEQPDSAESLFVGGDMGLGMLKWNIDTVSDGETMLLHAGLSLPSSANASQSPAYEIAPGGKVELPPVFLALAHGDADDAANEAFRYLKQHVFLRPVAGTPLATYCIWLTHPNSQEPLLDELKFARRMGFDVFYHDASWFENSSIVPGMNDWSKGLGAWRESRVKFPNGMKAFTHAVRASGLKCGIWVDPGNVDSERVASGEIPKSWVAMIDGKALETHHPSLSPMTQLCFGDPEVVNWVEQNLARIIGEWKLDWLKWDPSGTANYACNRTDHGHTSRNGLYAAYRGRMEILRYIMERFPQLSGFEVDPSLRYSRVNPGPPELLPGGYINEFITGPMVSPNVWGSLASAGMGEASADRLTGSWYSSSALDYSLRKHFMHGVTFGNINGMSAQLLSAAPAGFIEAFQRNLLYFKQYRQLLLEDVYHPALTQAQGWRAVQYSKEDRSEGVLFVFRDHSESDENSVKLRALAQDARYRVTSLNDRPGRDRIMSGEELTTTGLHVKLPDPWLAKGDGLPDAKFEDQLRYGSDVILFRRLK